MSQHFLLIEEGVLPSHLLSRVQEWGVRRAAIKSLRRLQEACLWKLSHVIFWLNACKCKEIHQPNQYYISYYCKRILGEYNIVLTEYRGIHHKNRSCWNSPGLRKRKEIITEVKHISIDMGQEGKFSTSDTINEVGSNCLERVPVQGNWKTEKIVFAKKLGKNYKKIDQSALLKLG